MEEKIKLEEELQFLKESLEADVISKSEYEKAKRDIENKISEIEAEEQKKKDLEKKEEEKPEVVTQKETLASAKESSKLDSESKPETYETTDMVTEEPKKSEEPRTELKEEEVKKEEIKQPVEETEKTEDILEKNKKEEISEVEKDTNDIINGKSTPKVEVYGDEEDEDIKGMWHAVIALFLIIIVGGLFFYFFVGNDDDAETSPEIGGGEEGFTPVCFNDDECEMEGKVGTCINPGQEDAVCEFKDIVVPTGLIILNTDECFNCDTTRVESILKGWFPGIVTEEIEHNSEEGKEIADSYGIEMLPAFILNGSLPENIKYDELSNIFTKVEDKYVLSAAASGSSYYIENNEIPNSLVLYLKSNDVTAQKTEDNLKEFLEAFDTEIDFERLVVEEQGNDAKDLGINTYPTFIVNNKIKFSGVHPAETIKQNFCMLNDLEQCSQELTKSLV